MWHRLVFHISGKLLLENICFMSTIGVGLAHRIGSSKWKVFFCKDSFFSLHNLIHIEMLINSPFDHARLKSVSVIFNGMPWQRYGAKYTNRNQILIPFIISRYLHLFLITPFFSSSPITFNGHPNLMVLNCKGPGTSYSNATRNEFCFHFSLNDLFQRSEDTSRQKKNNETYFVKQINYIKCLGMVQNSDKWLKERENAFSLLHMYAHLNGSTRVVPYQSTTNC